MTTEIKRLSLEDERSKTPEADPMWQDSVVLCWWDLEAEVGGYHRIGHHPGAPGGPRAHLSQAFFTADGVVKHDRSLALRDEDRPASGGFGSGDETASFEFTDHAIWRFDAADASGELHIEDFGAAVDIYPKRGQLAERITSGHLEAGGRITGQLEIAGVGRKVDGLAVRDRGWGVRHWDEILAHRWLAASFGPEATVFAVSVLGSHGELSDFACVIRGEEIMYSSEIDILTYVERDGISHRGGRVEMTMQDGERIELDIEPLQKGAFFRMADQFPICDTVCRITWGDRVGVGDFEMSCNQTRGTEQPIFALGAVVD